VRPTSFGSVALCLFVALSAVGCCSPYRTDQGALFGGLVGAGTGAIIGDAAGNAGAGTAIGAGIGALTGAVVGSELDQIEAQNRLMIEQQLGRQMAAGAVSMEDVMAMTRANVSEDLIVNHIRANGAARPLTTDDVILLTQQGVSSLVIKTLQSPPPRPVAMAPGGPPVIIHQSVPPPMIVEEYHYGPAFHPRWHRRHYHHSLGLGVTGFGVFGLNEDPFDKRAPLLVPRRQRDVLFFLGHCAVLK